MVGPDNLSDHFPLEPLTWREEDILRLLAERLSNREIAQNLGIGLETVKWYNKRLYAKLGVSGRRAATVRAKAIGFLDREDKKQAAISYNLPYQPTPFVGRQSELSDLSDLLQLPDVHLVTILAPGGMGKTRLALKLAEQQSPHYTDGVFFAPVTLPGSDDPIASTIAESVGLRLQVGGNPRRQVLQYLRNKQILLLLDNFERVLNSTGLITEILHTAPDVKLLVTSRQRLNLSGETIYAIGGMAIPGVDSAGHLLDEHDAVRLFLQSAQHVHPLFEVSANDWEHIVRICKLVHGMPLGIVLAAAWVRVLSPREIASEIIKDIDFLSTDMLDVPERQRSMRAVFTAAWRQLSGTAKTTFLKLSVCRGGFTLEAAQRIADANIPTLQLLADRGMLWRSSTGRFEVHELLRQFAEELLQQSKSLQDVYEIHGLFYAELLVKLEKDLRSKRQEVALSLIEDDFENVNSAWLYALEQANENIVALMLPSLYFFYETRSWFGEGEAAFKKATAKFSSSEHSHQRSLLLGRLLARQGAFAHRLGHYKQAAQALEASLSILKTTNARDELAFTLSFLADLARSLGKYNTSRQLCLQSLALFREIGETWGITGELHNLGVTAYHLGDFEEARDYYEESLARSRDLEDLYGIVTSLIGMGVLAHDLGDYQEAEILYTESLDISQTLDDRYGVAAALINLSRVYYLTDELEKGMLRCQSGLAISRDLGEPWVTAAALINLGDIACKMENFQESRVYFSEALQIVIELQSRPLEIEILVGVANLLAKNGRNKSALEVLTPVLQFPPGDKEIQERANLLLNSLSSSLSQESIDEIKEQYSGITLGAAVRQLRQWL